MSEKEQDTPAPEALDRKAYLRALRRQILKNLGLPEDTKPERVGRLLEIKAKLDSLKTTDK